MLNFNLLDIDLVLEFCLDLLILLLAELGFILDGPVDVFHFIELVLKAKDLQLILCALIFNPSLPPTGLHQLVLLFDPRLLVVVNNLGKPPDLYLEVIRLRPVILDFLEEFRNARLKMSGIVLV